MRSSVIESPITSDYFLLTGIILQRRENLDKLLIPRERAASSMGDGCRWFPAASGRKGRGFPFNRDSAIEQKPASLNSQVHRKAGGKNRAPCCLRNRIDGTVFQAVRSPGNINYKRKEQWKTFHPPDPLSPRAPSSPLAPVHSDICLDDGTRAPCFRRR